MVKMNTCIPEFRGFLYDPRMRYPEAELVLDTPASDDALELTIQFLLDEGEPAISGVAMIDRVRAHGKCAGQRHAERVVGAMGVFAPEVEVWGIFPGTIWRYENQLWVPYINCADYYVDSTLGFKPLNKVFGRCGVGAIPGECADEPVVYCT